jgi:hypothetical protein
LVGRTTVRSPATTIGRGLKPLDELTPEPDSTGSENQKKKIINKW